MLTLPTSLTLTLLSGLSLTPATVPAKGSQETLLTLDGPSTVKFSAKGSSGTACTIVDRVRGPFASSGVVGRTNCELDLLLDAGEYKIRLESPLKGKGQVTLTAVPYTEINTTPVQLQWGAGHQTNLQLGQTASYWVPVAGASTPYIHVVGRTAGDVRLWRNGQWLEPLNFSHTTYTLAPGLMVHDWWVDTRLEAGTYQVVVYGKNAAGQTVDSKDTTLTVTAGFLPAPGERAMAFTLPASGTLALEVPEAPFISLLQVLGSSKQPVSLTRFEWNGNGPFGYGDTCSVPANAEFPSCSVSSTRGTSGLRKVLVVRGAPGTRATLEWPATTTDAATQYFTSGDMNFSLDLSGSRLVSVHDIPLNTDAAPLGCLVESVDSLGNTKPIARRSTRVGEGQALKRTFNYEGNGQVIWFEVTSSSKFRIKTAGERKNHCEVYRFESDGRQTRLTTSKPGEMTCNQVLSLTKGHHSLQLFEGLSGIETVTIEEESGGLFSSKAPTYSAGLSSCQFEVLSLAAGSYRVSATRSAALRGLTVAGLPVSASTSLHLTLEPQSTLSVALASGSQRMARTVGGPALNCTLNKTVLPSNEGACAIPALKETQTLTLNNPGARPITVSIGAEGTLSASPAPQPFTPTLAPITQVKAGESAFFDFAKGQSHSVLFEVTNPGLYSATTQGLLSTSCMLRTAVAPNFANDSGSGRGRNCLIATSLQKGRYLMTATTVGESRGRAALALNRRGPREAQTQTGESEAFFRVEPDELIQQTLNIPSTGEWKLSTSGQGQTLQCRLDDAQGWPLETVPSQCTGQRMMKAGQYKWSQFPLTVESMRHTSLQKVRPAVVLKGKAAHQVEFFNWYDAELGDDGKDEFLFSLSGDTTLDVVLTSGMQGRVYRLEGTVAKPVEVIPAMESSNQNRNENGEGEAGEGDGESENTNQGDEGEYSEGEGESEGSEDRAPAAVEQPKVAQVPPPPHGAQIALPAGSYRIITEHSRGDVGISYRLHLGSLTLLPGMKRTVPVPSTMSIVVPADGTLRLKTQGEADVRCRLFDANGVRVLENGDNGSDWNCAIAEPVAKGTYRLDLESEVQRPGETLISLAVPPTEDKGALADGSSTKLQEAVATFALPTASDDTVHDLVFTSTAGLFSCAVENELGAVEARQLRSKRCALLIRPGSRKYRVRLWSNEGSPEVKTSLTSRTSKPLPIANAGRYSVKTAANCINGSEFGAMSNCWPEVSLEAGSAMFSVTGSANLPSMAELTATGSESPLNVSLNRRAFIQRLTAPAPSLFLMRATAPHGSAVTPACAFDGVTGGRESRSRECFAVSKVGTEATGRTWVTAGNDLTVALTRQAMSLPGSAESLATGRRHVTFSKTALFSLNPSTARLRVSVTLPKDGWAVLLGDNDVPLDVCAPSDTMRTCILTAGKSRLVLSATAGEADLNVTQLESEPRSTAFTGLFEFEAREPGSVQLPFTAQQENRSLTVQGALACALVLDNGARIEECRTTVSGGRSGTLFIEYDTGAIRAVLSTSAKAKATRFGLEAPLIPAAGLNVSVATALSGSRVDRTLVVSKDSVVRIAAASGVCALFKGTELLAVDGFNSGCEIIRVLGAGNYRVLVRPFADVALSGLLSWSAEAVTALTEGVGAETWVSPGEVKVYRFTTEAPGKVGFGVQVARDSLECSILDERYETVGEGCQQYLSLKKGAYLLLLKQPQRAVTPIAVKPVLLGLSGDQNQVPPEFLKDFFNRIRSN